MIKLNSIETNILDMLLNKNGALTFLRVNVRDNKIERRRKKLDTRRRFSSGLSARSICVRKDARSTSWLPKFLAARFSTRMFVDCQENGSWKTNPNTTLGPKIRITTFGFKFFSEQITNRRSVSFSSLHLRVSDEQSILQMFSQNVNQGSQEIRRPQRIALVPYDESSQETNRNEDSTRRLPKVKHAVIQDQSYRQQIVAKKRRFKAGTKALMEIRKYQKSTALLIQKAPFCRVVKDTIYEMSGRQDMRVQSEAVSALQEAAEAFIIQLFEAASLCARHGRRVTVMPADFQLVRNVLNIFTSGGLIT
ncbi:Histone domain-containing protein [Aphelenchoides besseyi]|nr:Histone domain-containing protein [Aphelenchoides besseyi]